jgi:hypothetical protein
MTVIMSVSNPKIYAIALETPPVHINEFPLVSFHPLVTLIHLHFEIHSSFGRCHSKRTDVHFNFLLIGFE